MIFSLHFLSSNPNTVENCYKRKVMNLNGREFFTSKFLSIYSSSEDVRKRLANTCFFACSLKRVRVTTKSPHLNVPSEDCRYFAQVVNKNVEDVTYCRLLPFNLYMSPPGVYLTVADGELGSTLHMNLSAFSRVFCKALGSLS